MINITCRLPAYRDQDELYSHMLSLQVSDFLTFTDGVDVLFQLNRLVVVDSDRRVEGVVSLSDILRRLVLSTTDDAQTGELSSCHQTVWYRAVVVSAGVLSCFSTVTRLSDVFILPFFFFPFNQNSPTPFPGRRS